MRSTRRQILIGAAGLSLVGSGCRDPEPTGRFGRFRARDGQVLFFNNFAEPEYLDPALLTGHPDAFVARQLFEGLVESHPRTLAPEPGVAERWEVSADGRRVLFHLREHARWSDGTRVTAHDFVYSWERVLRPSTAARYAYQLYPVEGARLYNQGRIMRVLGEQVRPRRPPFVVFGQGGARTTPTLESFALGATVRLVASNLRMAKERTTLPLLASPDASADPVATLDPSTIAVVLARRVPPGADDQPGAPAPEAWVQLRQPSGRRAGWTRETDVRDAFPSVDMRRVEGERRGERSALRAGPEVSTDIVAFAEDEDEVEVLERKGPMQRVRHVVTGLTGWVHEDVLDDAVGDRNWFFVEVMRGQQEGGLEGAALRGWLPARDLTADASVLGLRAPDRRRLEVTLEAPTPYFVSLCSLPTLRPVPQRLVERQGRSWTRPEHIVTNGPFHLAFHRPRDRMELIRSASYHGRDAVALDRAVVYAVEDEHTSVNMYRAGYLDASLSAKLPVELVPQLRRRSDYVSSPYFATYFIKLNTTQAPLNDVRVRRALNLAVDKTLLCDRLLRGGQTPATHLVPPGLPGYPVIEGEAHDPELARKLLAEAGFPGGQGFPTLTYLYNTSEHHRVVAEYLQRQWVDELGIELRLTNQEWKTYLQRLHSMDYDVCKSGWIGDYLDPNTFLDLFVTGGGNNETGFADPAYDALVTRSQTMPAGEERMAVLAEAERRVGRAMPIVPLYYFVNNFLRAPEVEGYHSNLLDEHTLKHVRLTRTGGEESA
jgi:oligopeptide transport system substrate-binding protein